MLGTLFRERILIRILLLTNFGQVNSMSNVKITVQIKITPTDEAATALSQSSKDGSFSIVLHDACFNINALEQGLLNTTYPALRASLSQALEEAAEIKAREAQREYSIVRRESNL